MTRTDTTRTARRLALVVGAGIAASMATSAQAYEWGGGTCVGYGCVAAAHDSPYREVSREYRDGHYAPRVRVYEERRRVVVPENDWDDDDED